MVRALERSQALRKISRSHIRKSQAWLVALVILVLGTGSSLVLIGQLASLHDKLQAGGRPYLKKQVSEEWPWGCHLSSTSMHIMCVHTLTCIVSHTWTHMSVCMHIHIQKWWKVQKAGNRLQQHTHTFYFYQIQCAEHHSWWLSA